MKKCCLLFIVLLVFAFCFTSCSTTEAAKVDIVRITDPVLMQRPDNSLLKIHEGPIFELSDVLENSNTYLYAWGMWENYADTLEKTLISIKENLR